MLIFESEDEYNHMMLYYFSILYQILHIIHRFEYYINYILFIVISILDIYFLYYFLNLKKKDLETIQIIFTSLLFLSEIYSLNSTL